MAEGAVAPSSRYIFCVPPHTHALLRFRVQTVTASHVAYFADSGVGIDRRSGAVLTASAEGAASGPVRIVPRVAIDAARSWEGVAPDAPTYYSSFEAFQRMQELALVQYGTIPPQHDVDAYEVEVLRQRMMDAHPDRGGTEETFTEARAAYEAARRRNLPK